MTKLRPPLTIENALDRIAGVIGWPKVAEIAGYGERAVRKWSDPDCEPRAADKISLALARKLDLAYRAAGGHGSPLLECHALLLETELAEAFADKAALAESIALAAKEAGEAIAAGVMVTRPGATIADVAIAERELEQSISASTHTLATLRRGRRGDVSKGTHESSSFVGDPRPGGAS